MKITRVGEKEHEAIYMPLCKTIVGASDELETEISGAIDILDAKLREALSDYDDEEDYQLSYDWNACWHHCGAILSKKAFFRDLVDKIHAVMIAESHPWCLHMACEPEFDGMGDGEIFFYDGKIYADDSCELDYHVFE